MFKIHLMSVLVATDLFTVFYLTIYVFFVSIHKVLINSIIVNELKNILQV